MGTTSVLVVGIRENATSTLDFMAHEGFHAYQERTFARPDMPGTGVPEGVLGPEPSFTIQVDVERTALDRAVHALNAEVRHSAIADFLDARARRMQAWPDSMRRAEDQTERIEGSAQYVGFRIASELSEDPRQVMRDTLHAALLAPMSTFPTMLGAAQRLFRWRLYATGAAQLVLLDDEHVAWQALLASGASPSELLARMATPSRR
jgi:hypothetical protein